MNEKELLILFLTETKKIKSGKEKEAAQYLLKLSEEDANKLKLEYAAWKKSKKQKLLHGAKLNYIKSLKNQCADDEELYYYKKGGSIGCGCKKKEDGGEVTKAEKGTVVDKFKAKKMQKAGKITKTSTKLEIWPTDTVHIYNPKTKNMEVRDLSGKLKQFKKLTKEEYLKQSPIKKADIDSKGYKCGGPVEKFKKHRLGGNLNRTFLTLRVSATA